MTGRLLAWLNTPHLLVLARGQAVRRVTCPGWMLVGASSCVAALLAWGVVATSLIMVHDGAVSGLESRHSAVEGQYEDRIAALRTQIERIRSQQVVDQGTVADRLEALLRRQSALEQRQAVVQSLGGGSVEAPAAEQDPVPAVAPEAVPDVSQTVRIRGKQALLVPGAPRLASLGPAGAPRLSTEAGRGSADTIIAQVTGSLDGLEQRQVQALGAIQGAAERRVAKVRDVLDELGLNADRLRLPASAMAQEGGPLLPLQSPGPDAGAFEQQVYRTQTALIAGKRLDALAAALPLRHPFAHAEITSGFGARLDPFLGTAAIHPGIDFRQEDGAPVRVTAGGRVTQAGWVGGYGNMVEVDHANGLATRYGHLSAILVSVGDRVAQGQTVGRVGSTGRSTGPHLHYETRIDGEAVDPLRFMRAGDELARRG